MRKEKVQDVIIINIYLLAILSSIAILVAGIWLATKLRKVWLCLTTYACRVYRCIVSVFGGLVAQFVAKPNRIKE